MSPALCGPISSLVRTSSFLCSIACDGWASSPFRGRCYLSYSDLATDRIATRFSADGGLTWSAAVFSPDNAGRTEGVANPS